MNLRFIITIISIFCSAIIFSQNYTIDINGEYLATVKMDSLIIYKTESSTWRIIKDKLYEVKIDSLFFYVTEVDLTDMEIKKFNVSHKFGSSDILWGHKSFDIYEDGLMYITITSEITTYGLYEFNFNHPTKLFVTAGYGNDISDINIISDYLIFEKFGKILVKPIWFDSVFVYTNKSSPYSEIIKFGKNKIIAASGVDVSIIDLLTKEKVTIFNEATNFDGNFCFEKKYYFYIDRFNVLDYVQTNFCFINESEPSVLNTVLTIRGSIKFYSVDKEGILHIYYWPIDEFGKVSEEMTHLEYDTKLKQVISETKNCILDQYRYY